MNPSEWRPEIEGWSSDILPFYESMASSAEDGALFVEVGVYKGRSLLYLAECLARRGKSDCNIIGVDIWHKPWWDEFSRHLQRAPERERRLVGFLRKDSAEAARDISDESVDLVFIDADHSYEGVRRDIEAWTPKIKPGGIISGHDYESNEFPGVVRAVNEAFGERPIGRPSGTVWMVQL